MLDTFIIFGTILSLILAGYGLSNYKPWAVYFAAVLIAILGIGLFTTGFETHDNAQVYIYTNEEPQRLVFQTTTYNANLGGTTEEQITYAVSLLFITMGLGLTALAIRETNYNRRAGKEYER